MTKVIYKHMTALDIANHIVFQVPDGRLGHARIPMKAHLLSNLEPVELYGVKMDAVQAEISKILRKPVKVQCVGDWDNLGFCGMVPHPFENSNRYVTKADIPLSFSNYLNASWERHMTKPNRKKWATFHAEMKELRKKIKDLEAKASKIYDRQAIFRSDKP